jgi:hypothetical protein
MDAAGVSQVITYVGAGCTKLELSGCICGSQADKGVWGICIKADSLWKAAAETANVNCRCPL